MIVIGSIAAIFIVHNNQQKAILESVLEEAEEKLFRSVNLIEEKGKMLNDESQGLSKKIYDWEKKEAKRKIKQFVASSSSKNSLISSKNRRSGKNVSFESKQRINLPGSSLPSERSNYLKIVEEDANRKTPAGDNILENDQTQIVEPKLAIKVESSNYGSIGEQLGEIDVAPLPIGSLNNSL